MGIKLLLLQLVLSTIVLFSSFNTNLYCRVQGYLYYDGYDISSLDRNDLCSMVWHELSNNEIILFTKDHWVMIKIPDDTKGFVSFWYKWGSSDAYINGKAVKIVWGFVLRG